MFICRETITMGSLMVTKGGRHCSADSRRTSSGNRRMLNERNGKVWRISKRGNKNIIFFEIISFLVFERAQRTNHNHRALESFQRCTADATEVATLCYSCNSSHEYVLIGDIITFAKPLVRVCVIVTGHHNACVTPMSSMRQLSLRVRYLFG